MELKRGMTVHLFNLLHFLIFSSSPKAPFVIKGKQENESKKIKTERKKLFSLLAFIGGKYREKNGVVSVIV
jgi:hypothetical protein